MEQSVMPAAALASTLFYFEQAPEAVKSEHKCLGYLHDVMTGSRTVIWAKPDCPAHVLLDKNTLYFSLREKLYVRSLLAPKEEPKLLADLPDRNVNLWLDEKTGKVRGAYFRPVEGAKRRKNKNGEYVFTYRGKTYSTYGSGSLGMAIATELEGGKWRNVEESPTDSEACDTLGLSVLKASQHDGRGTNVNHLINSPFNSVEAEEVVVKTLKAEGSEFRKVVLTHQKQLYFDHFDHGGRVGPPKTPIYFCDNPCRKLRKVDWIVDGGISMAVKGNLLLVSEGGDRPRVYDVTREEIVLTLPLASMAVWVQ
jgi:hypothetical protein